MKKRMTKQERRYRQRIRMKNERLQSLQLYHYTKGCHLDSIIESGELRTTSCHIDKNERPAVWVSSNENWEETVRIDVFSAYTFQSLSRDAMSAYGIVPVRFLIDAKTVKIHPWDKFKRISGISKQRARGLEVAGYDDGADPREWFVSFEAISAESWLSIECWTGSEWRVVWTPSDSDEAA